MIREYPNVRQHEGERRRRWFDDDFFDLIVWFEKDDSVYGFQLCYDVLNNQHSLTWKIDSGFHHHRIDTGTEPIRHKKTDLLVNNGPFPYKKVIDEFLDRISGENKEIYLFVYDKLLEYTNSGACLE